MRKTFGIIHSATLSFFLSLFFAAPSFAAEGFLCPKDKAFGKLCDLSPSGDGFSQLIGTAISIALIAAVVIALFFLIWGGIKWILSGGDKGGVEAARNTIIASIIGLVVTLAAYFILNFVLGFFGLSLSNIELPKFVN